MIGKVEEEWKGGEELPSRLHVAIFSRGPENSSPGR